MRPNSELIIILLLILLSLLPVVYLKKTRFDHQKRVSLPVTLISKAEGRVYHFDLEEYLIGVVAAEMPARFEMEALKVQAVAARTLAVRRMKRFGGQGCRHYPNADFCDDPAENQAWLGIKSLRQRWPGWSFNIYYNKIRRAIQQTSGIIMTYHNRPIDAVFHSTCGVGTTSAKEVWHYDIPYLSGVVCGFDRHSPKYRNNFFFTWNELERRFNLPAAFFKNIKIQSATPQGRISKLALGKLVLTGNEFRNKLGLTSTSFTWKVNNSGLTFAVAGYGHGVGLCQYGADGLAKRGWTYQAILKYYYRGISFAKIRN